MLEKYNDSVTITVECIPVNEGIGSKGIIETKQRNVQRYNKQNKEMYGVLIITETSG